ncbi:MAG TPA: gamma carbonic anhydrase family protein, partial [Flavobacteriales bacterium]|nr:gamma carbonic anhydrase family protein [Flavobacteriales bacterium]
HIGHGAIVHGATVGENSLIGMNAVLMDNVKIGKNCIVGALAFLPEGMEIPDRKVVVGNPAKILKDVSDEMINWKTEGTKLYQALPKELHNHLVPCEPLREEPENSSIPTGDYKTWKQSKPKDNE